MGDGEGGSRVMMKLAHHGKGPLQPTLFSACDAFGKSFFPLT